MSDWYCEDHPEHLMGHNGCNGAGIPANAQMFMLIIQRRNALQKYNDLKAFYEPIIYELIKVNERLELIIENLNQ